MTIARRHFTLGRKLSTKRIPLGHPRNPIPLPARRVLVNKTMFPTNPFDNSDDEEGIMPPPHQEGPPRMRVYRFLADGGEVEALTYDNHVWYGTLRDPDGKTLKTRTFYSEAMARHFVETETT